MKEYRDINEWTSRGPGSAIVPGRFDGVHLGHRALLERTVGIARTNRLTPVCFSFQESGYPRVKERGILTTNDEKKEIMAEIGIEVLIHPTFDKPLIDMSAHDFLHSMLIEKWGAKYIVAGYDFHFGRERGGDTDFLIHECEAKDVEIEIFSPFVVGKEIVKATAIRECIGSGEVKHARELLGRPYSIRVRARKGKGLGRVIGFSTINFGWPGLKVKPLPGIYAVAIESDIFQMDDKTKPPLKLRGVANFGFRPTIDPDNTEPLLEVHILDEVPDHIEEASELPPDAEFIVEFIDFIRVEKKFDSIEELTSQIGKDCEIAREILDQSH